VSAAIGSSGNERLSEEAHAAGEAPPEKRKINTRQIGWQSKPNQVNNRQRWGGQRSHVRPRRIIAETH
jgi:hypothetical protein